ncbi:SH3 domain-containing protein [Saprospira sp. CCB-QB6]|uniref:SH3 domain-containing protein n=1 Tax=Saprospira sp. CCB-QB6 TaxID=3023936 RepID=UPI00234A10CD|nr:SH3 domain-containing protein [Saprospira sp. CCB-QB6]WCL81474.1 SH3 domain-containing protein [Saprospira sp. CCB-QB6]
MSLTPTSSLFLLLSMLIFWTANAQDILYNKVAAPLLHEPEAESAMVEFLLQGELLYPLQKEEGDFVAIENQSGRRGWLHKQDLSTEAIRPQYRCFLSNLRLRSQGNLKASVVAKLQVGELVRFTGRRSPNKETISIRGQKLPHYWLEVETQKGLIAWTYGGGLEKLVPIPTIPGNPDVENETTKPKTEDKTENTNSHLELPHASKVKQAESLFLWWNALQPEWKAFYNQMVLLKPIEQAYSEASLAEIEQIMRLEELDLSQDDACKTGPFYAVPLKNLSGLSGLPLLKRLHGRGLQLENLNGLRQLTNLEELSLTELHLQQLLFLPKKLKKLQLAFAQEQEFPLQLLEGQTQLQELHIQAQKIKDLDRLIQLPKIKKLSLHISDLRSTQGINSLFLLEELSLKAEQSDLDLRPLAGLSRLKKLSLLADEVQNMNSLVHLQQLQELELNVKANRIDARLLARFKAMRWLKIKTPELSQTESLAELKALQFFACQQETAFPIQHLPKQIQQLELAATNFQNLKTLAQFPNLQSLELSSIALQGLGQIPALEKLEKLYIKAPKLINLKNLNPLPNLRLLDLSQCPELQSFEELKQLQQLELLYLPKSISLQSELVQNIHHLGLIIRHEALSGCF